MACPSPMARHHWGMQQAACCQGPVWRLKAFMEKEGWRAFVVETQPQRLHPASYAFCWRTVLPFCTSNMHGARQFLVWHCADPPTLPDLDDARAQHCLKKSAGVRRTTPQHWHNAALGLLLRAVKKSFGGMTSQSRNGREFGRDEGGNADACKVGGR